MHKLGGLVEEGWEQWQIYLKTVYPDRVKMLDNFREIVRRNRARLMREGKEDKVGSEA